MKEGPGKISITHFNPLSQFFLQKGVFLQFPRLLFADSRCTFPSALHWDAIKYSA